MCKPHAVVSPFDAQTLLSYQTLESGDSALRLAM
jgi:hypothetical protein